MDSGRVQLVRSIKEPTEIAAVVTVKKIARALLDEISPEDRSPYYEEFVKDVGEVESMNGPLNYHSDSRNRLVTSIAENYVPRETGRIICPACLTETPNNQSICIRCSGSLVSWGKGTTKQSEGAPPGVPEQEKPPSGSGSTDAEGDVDMDMQGRDRSVGEGDQGQN